MKLPKKVMIDDPRYDEVARQRLLAFRRISPTGCWEFTRYLKSNGYGQIGYKNEPWYVHRLSFKLFRSDEYKEHLFVLHKCDNPRCFNPDHLFQGDQSDNMTDASIKGRSQKTHCINGHELIPENTYLHSDGIRRCRICKNNYARVSYLLKQLDSGSI